MIQLNGGNPLDWSVFGNEFGLQIPEHCLELTWSISNSAGNTFNIPATLDRYDAAPTYLIVPNLNA